MEGSQEKQKEGKRRGERNGINKEEVKTVIVKLKDKKAVEVDGIPAEVWKYGGQEVEEWYEGFAIESGREKVG